MEPQQNAPQEAGTNPPQGSPAPAPAAQDNSTLMGILAYIGILVLIPLLAAKGNAFVQYHVKQGLVLLILEVAVYIIGMMVYGLWMIIPLVNLGLIVLSIFGIVNVINKKQTEVPLVGQFAQYLKF
jgi:uncharacterized membrane protein